MTDYDMEVAWVLLIAMSFGMLFGAICGVSQ
jgi:hypothetical protein